MALRVGDKLGPYEVLSPIGSGGMGEVYKARDTRLDRIVAIKTSKTEFSERFEREARAVAALNHPNICQLYDLGTLPGGGSYLVMEFVDGSPIAAVDSPRRLLDLAVQLADGMAAAHSAGFTHRDLKPDNILVTGPQTPHPGRVKILDFGLAKLTPLVPQTEDTQTVGMTNPGTLMGTVAYMSPEQARGEPVDARSDQFSFGLILYELATRKRPFIRGSSAETMAAIIREEAEPLPNTPAPLRWVVERCLAKDPAERYDSTKDLYRELKLARERLSEASASANANANVEVGKKGSRGRAWSAVAGLVGLAGLAGVVAGAMWLGPGKEKLRYTPMEVTWTNPSLGFWAPDGKGFAYSAEVNGVLQVFVRYLDAPVPVQLTRSKALAEALGWSADSKRVVFVSRNTKGTKPLDALFTVPVTGGEPEWVQPIEGAFRAISPDGGTVAELRSEAGGLGLYLAPLGGTAQKYQPWPIESKAFFNYPQLRFAPDGKSVWLWIDLEVGRQLWRFPLPSESGVPQRMLDKEMPMHGATPMLSFLDGERHAVVALQDGVDEDATHLWMVDSQSAKRERLTEGTAMESLPSLAPDGARLLYVSANREYRVVSMSVEDASVEKVILSGRMVGMPGWAAGQEKFAYVSQRNGAPAVWVRDNGADRPLVTAAMFEANPAKWFLTPALSPDGGRAIFLRVGLDNRNENWISSLSGGPPIRLTSNGPEVQEYGGSWSSDGSRFVFLQFQKGKYSMAVAKTSGEAAATMLRPEVAESLPQWSPDGKWIKYLDEKRGWVLVSPDGKEELVLGISGALELTFSKDGTRLYGIRSKDGRHTLFSVDLATKAEQEIREIDKEYVPGSRFVPVIRLSLSPDGKRILYPTYKEQRSLWMIERFRRPGWLP